MDVSAKQKRGRIQLAAISTMSKCVDKRPPGPSVNYRKTIRTLPVTVKKKHHILRCSGPNPHKISLDSPKRHSNLPVDD